MEVRRTVSQLGISNALVYYAARALTLLTGGRARLLKYYFVAQPVPPIQDVPAHRFVGFRIEEVDAEFVLKLRQPRPPSVIRSRFLQGSRCLALFHGEQFAAFIWLTIGPHREDEVWCSYVPSPTERAAWDFDVFVDERFRMGRAFAALWNGANKYLADRNIAWTMSRISATNPMSVRSHRSMGAIIVGSAYFLRIGSRLQFAVLPSHPHVHFCCRESRSPVVRINPPLSEPRTISAQHTKQVGR